jgi:hypothetical protein
MEHNEKIKAILKKNGISNIDDLATQLANEKGLSYWFSYYSTHWWGW